MASLNDIKLGRRGFLGSLLAAPVALKSGVQTLMEGHGSLRNGIGVVQSLVSSELKYTGDDDSWDRTDGAKSAGYANDSRPELAGKDLVNFFRRRGTPKWLLAKWELMAKDKAYTMGIAPEIDTLKSINIHTKRRMQIRTYMYQAQELFEANTIIDDTKQTWMDKFREKYSIPWFG